MYEKIKKIIEEQLGIKDSEKVTLTAKLKEDLDADSLDAVEIIMAIEDAFSIEIPDEVAEEANTIEEIIKYIESNA